MFDDFWAAYPRKMAKSMARKAWAKLTASQQMEALEALPSHIQYFKVKEIEKDFIPYPATWLNQERWEDEIDLTKPEKPKLPWYSSDSLTMEHGQKLGLPANPGESMQQYRSRLASVRSPTVT